MRGLLGLISVGLVGAAVGVGSCGTAAQAQGISSRYSLDPAQREAFRTRLRADMDKLFEAAREARLRGDCKGALSSISNLRRLVERERLYSHVYLSPRDREDLTRYSLDLINKLPSECPPPPPPPRTAGLYIGGEILKNWGTVQSTERLAATGAVTNRFTDHADPLGGGLIIGYQFAPWANNVIVSPFVSLDFLHAPVNHTFPGGSYLGTTANFMGTFGVKAGPQLDMGLWLYGIAGVSALNETLNVNFVPTSSSRSVWVAGGTLGLGAAWQPTFLQGYGRPVSLFLEYQHTWWQDADFNTPAASPAFNYTFSREDDVVKFGFIVFLNGAN